VARCLHELLRPWGLEWRPGVAHMAGVEHIQVWRLRAEELRLLAGTLDDASARLGVLHAARNYDAMAADAEARLGLDALLIGPRQSSKLRGDGTPCNRSQLQRSTSEHSATSVQ